MFHPVSTPSTVKKRRNFARVDHSTKSRRTYVPTLHTVRGTRPEDEKEKVETAS
jgi:hypothetical protein